MHLSSSACIQRFPAVVCVAMKAMLVPLLLALVAATASRVEAGLSSKFYDKTCPSYELTVSRIVNDFLSRDATIAPGLMRMHFHDCFVNGCDASVLLNSTGGVPSERNAGPNLSLHGFDVLDAIKAELETQCRGVVSCADILATATRDAVSATSKFSWKVKLGRRDGNVSLASQVNLPSPFEDASTLISKFQAKGLNARELVLLQGGGHSIGIGHCGFVLGRLSNFGGTGAPDPSMNATYVQTLAAQCNGNGNVALNNDPVTPDLLDSQYFVNLQNHMGLFTSDQELLSDSRTSRSIVQYATGKRKLEDDFGKAMTKMSEIGVLTFPQGSIRSNCAIAN